MNKQNLNSPIIPYKSIAIALLFCVFFGPVGLLYASIWGGVFMLILAIIMMSNKFFFLSFLVWVVCCIWAVRAVESYNKKIFTVLYSR